MEILDKIEKVITLDKDTDEDDYDDEDEEGLYLKKNFAHKIASEDSKDHESTTEKEEQDPYFKDDSNANEHDRFRDAEERLEKKHRKKVTKVKYCKLVLTLTINVFR